ncbi:N-acetyltransferase family 8 member 3 [Esox lucius]|uniref:N-acetyltransferase family 8 member 3 n=1 Tax=Esox lucius TaxID=8010 RepID=UPI00147770BC|nr:N-acetyltransferase family 8 member 3 [Esox lucius]
MHLVVRRYRPSDKESVLALFREGILEHINPSFYRAVSDPLHVGISLLLSLAGCLLGGLTAPWALLLPGAWVGLIYYCCWELYAAFVRERLRTDMQDIPGCYLTSPNNCFWVAEAEVNGRVEILGMGAIVAKKVEGGREGEMCGELFRMIVSPRCRRMGLGSRITQTIVDFCKERGFSKVVLETSSTQVSAVALYKKMGFIPVLSHTKTYSPEWMTLLSRVTILKMEKVI